MEYFIGKIQVKDVIVDKLEIFGCGTNVTFKLSNINAIITAINIRGSHVSYEASYFDKNDYKSIWITSDEFIKTSINKKTEIGFKCE